MRKVSSGVLEKPEESLHGEELLAAVVAPGHQKHSLRADPTPKTFAQLSRAHGFWPPSPQVQLQQPVFEQALVM
jgi:hypothetical protein